MAVHDLRICFITIAERELMLPFVTKRIFNHIRFDDVTEGYAVD